MVGKKYEMRGKVATVEALETHGDGRTFVIYSYPGTVFAEVQHTLALDSFLTWFQPC